MIKEFLTAHPLDKILKKSEVVEKKFLFPKPKNIPSGTKTQGGVVYFKVNTFDPHREKRQQKTIKKSQ